MTDFYAKHLYFFNIKAAMDQWELRKNIYANEKREEEDNGVSWFQGLEWKEEKTH